MEKFQDKRNIAILARLGIFHSGVNTPTFKFVNPDTGKLMFNPNDWAPEILDIHINQNRIWSETFNNKLVIERIKTAADGTPGIGKRYGEVIEILKSKGLLVEDLRKTPLPDIFREKYYYKRGNEVYRSASKFIKERI